MKSKLDVKNNENLFGHLLAGATIFVWSSTFLASDSLLDVNGAFRLTPTQLIVMRFIVSYVALLIIRPRISKPVLRDEIGFALMGVVGCTLYYFTENSALLYTSPSNVSIIVAAAPILTSVLAHFTSKDEKMTLNTLWGFLIAFLGVILVVLNGVFVLKLSPLGDFLALAAALMWAIYSVLLKPFVAKYDSIELTRRVLFYGVLSSAILLLIENKPLPSADVFAIPGLWFRLGFLGLIGSGVCYVTWNMAVKRIGVVISNNYIYLGPFITILMEYLIRNVIQHKSDTVISLMSIIGAVLIVFGVIVSSMKRKNDRSKV